MKTVVGEFASQRTEPNEVSKLVLEHLAVIGVDVKLLELDDENRDNLFVYVRDTDYLSGIYIGIEQEDGMVNIWLNDRGHSGGDPTFDMFDFSESELNSNLVLLSTNKR
jgi:hypothetical protein